MTLYFYNKNKYANLIETPEAIVKVVQICIQTLLPLCQIYILYDNIFDTMAATSKKDIFAVRYEDMQKSIME